MITVTQNNLNTLVPYEHKIGNKTTFTRFSKHMTMVDGKVWNSTTGTLSTMHCYICKLAIKDFNNLDNVFKYEVD